jgi:hypothetical protein
MGKEKEIYGGPQLSRQERGKSERLKARAKGSRQERKAHGKSERLKARAKGSRQERNF